MWVFLYELHVGARESIITDIGPHVPLMHKNLELNKQRGYFPNNDTVKVDELFWYENTLSLSHTHTHFFPLFSA